MPPPHSTASSSWTTPARRFRPSWCHLAQQNANAKEIGQLFKAGKQAEAAAAKEKTAALKEVSKQLEEKLKQNRG